jgi:hypothetical protein
VPASWDGGSLRPWLLGIAVNLTRNQACTARWNDQGRASKGGRLV